MKTSELRERFLSFFEERGHRRHDSDSLVPSADPTLLFTSAGMNQFKDYFQDAEGAPVSRATSCQKCFRTGDIEEVGTTPYHLTFFEMLGNFSFGDYFKEEAIAWAWEFVREELEFERDKLCVSVYEDDDEAYRIWNSDIGLDAERIYHFGESENFWPANAPSEGPNGPCGPCSEIHYDYGPDAGCGSDDCDPACCDRYSELYNLVFMEFERQEGGTLEPLPQKNIDTGMGLERTAAILQDKSSVFQTDQFRPIVQHTAELLDVAYSLHHDCAPDVHRIADHIRASVFLISDGVLPSNEGRGYVHRKLLRRAVDCAMNYGVDEPVLWNLVDPVVGQMGETYSKISEAADNARNLIRNEESNYLETIEQGDALLQQMMGELEEQNEETLAGSDAFLLYDTYGFPLSRTRQILEKEGYKLDEEGFEQAMEQQREQAREETEISSDVFGTGTASQIQADLRETNFLGYHSRRSKSKIRSIVDDDGSMEEASEGDQIALITADTPFYAEAGGQVGDAGTIRTDTGLLHVSDTQKHDGIYVHHGTVEEGNLRTGEVASLQVDEERRDRIQTHHTGTHILNAILRDELGDHVQQAGSLVAPDHLRFDFSHPEALSEEEIENIEYRANRRIMENHPVESEHTTLEEARERGALMFFGDKYGDIVRTVRIGDFSLELCGGTHLEQSRDASMFKILSESSVASGTRRIEAVCGFSAIEQFIETRQRVTELSQMLSTPPDQLTDRVRKMKDEIKELQKELKDARQSTTGNLLSDLEDQKESIQGLQVLVQNVDQAHPDNLRALVDDLVNNRGLDVVLLGTTNDDSVTFALRVSDAAQEQDVTADEFIRIPAEHVGGGGGGRDDFAQAGGPNTEQVGDALDVFSNKLKQRL